MHLLVFNLNKRNEIYWIYITGRFFFQKAQMYNKIYKTNTVVIQPKQFSIQIRCQTITLSSEHRDRIKCKTNIAFCCIGSFTRKEIYFYFTVRWWWTFEVIAMVTQIWKGKQCNMSNIAWNCIYGFYDVCECALHFCVYFDQKSTKFMWMEN